MSDDKQHFDLIKRGEKAPSPKGTLTFVGLRLLDLPIQYALLSPNGLGTNLLAQVGVTSVSSPDGIAALLSLSPALLSAGLPAFEHLGTGSLLLAMAAGSTAKQIYWQTRISQESFPPPAAAAVSVYNTLVNSANSLLFMTLATTSLRSGPLVTLPVGGADGTVVPLSVAIGTLCYVVGMGIETLSEVQRSNFKAKPENKGKVCKEGLWGYARHVNYFGYALWRGGYCMAASGWIGGLAMGLFQGWDFSTRAIPVLDSYCGDRYGEQWAQFKRDVPYKIIPGVY
ncbi:hypothetical protein F5Y15DRAFT_262715 [Xylariaceae sp. FL0016]|nr:hypothetical protein F5Y15DRAFT_262715 [Xylariaceae sp. FL0016]